jgi:hypothetical protein
MEKRKLNLCRRCKHTWFQRGKGRPKICPNCKSKKWNKPLYIDIIRMHEQDKLQEDYGNPNTEFLDGPINAVCPNSGKSYCNALVYTHPETGAKSLLCPICADENDKPYWYKWHYLPTGQREATDKQLMDIVNQMQGRSINQLAKVLDWSYGRTNWAIKRLIGNGLIEIKEEMTGRRVQYNVFSL